MGKFFSMEKISFHHSILICVWIVFDQENGAKHLK